MIIAMLNCVWSNKQECMDKIRSCNHAVRELGMVRGNAFVTALKNVDMIITGGIPTDTGIYQIGYCGGLKRRVYHIETDGAFGKSETLERFLRRIPKQLTLF